MKANQKSGRAGKSRGKVVVVGRKKGSPPEGGEGASDIGVTAFCN